MNRLRPAPASIEDVELWNRVLDAAGAQGLTSDALRNSVLRHAVTELCAKLGDDQQLRALADTVESEDADGLPGARFQAVQLDLSDQLATIILFLISERTTSCAACATYAMALALAAAHRFGATKTLAQGHALGTQAAELHRIHGAAFSSFLGAQYELTQRLLAGLTSVTLHRGIRITQPNHKGEIDPRLRPLSSFSTRASNAMSLATHGLDARGEGEIVVISAVVPVDRVLSTPATGSGAVLEREVVVAIGASGDCAAVSQPSSLTTD